MARIRIARTVLACSVLILGGCGGGSPAPVGSSAPTPTPTPAATVVAYDVEPCFTRPIPGTGGETLRAMIVPDVLKLDLTRPSGYPNGRDLDDPVIDITLSWLFLDFGVTGQSPLTFANLPLNPAANDRPFSDTFPFLAPPQGNPPLPAIAGTSFNFRTDPDSAFVRVDRMGMPAVATALIGSTRQETYNDADPTADSAGQFKADETTQLTNLFNGIGDDLTALGLKLCARTT